MFTLKIETDNAAFEDDNLLAEVARILRVAADKVEQGDHPASLRDVNGNKVGDLSFDN